MDKFVYFERVSSFFWYGSLCKYFTGKRPYVLAGCIWELYTGMEREREDMRACKQEHMV